MTVISGPLSVAETPPARVPSNMMTLIQCFIILTFRLEMVRLGLRHPSLPGIFLDHGVGILARQINSRGHSGGNAVAATAKIWRHPGSSDNGRVGNGPTGAEFQTAVTLNRWWCTERKHSIFSDLPRRREKKSFLPLPPGFLYLSLWACWFPKVKGTGQCVVTELICAKVPT